MASGGVTGLITRMNLEAIEKDVTGAVDVLIPDVGVKEVWNRLSEEADVQLIDVRTQAELAFVGVPDLTEIGKQPLFVEWERFPNKCGNEQFVENLSVLLRDLGATDKTALFFLCRSGVRSRKAALAMSNSGFIHCHNVADGFEGPLDGERHRGRLAGWKAHSLPWAQT